jgi:hypothetical protein
MQGQFDEALRCVDESFSILTALDDDLGVHWAFVAYSKLLARHGQLVAHAVWAEGQAMTMAELNALVRSVASRTAPQLASG